MDANRKAWNDRQKKLRQALEKSGDQKAAVGLFLTQHAMVHSSKLLDSPLFSFEDEVLNDLSIERLRHIPTGSNHSIAWIIWHLARIEDVTMTLLVADKPQVLHQGGWFP